MDAAVSEGSSQYLTFQLAGEEFAVGILKVREILELPPLTRVPKTPQFVRGVMNLRGSVVPVIDLAVKFGLPETTATRWTCVVVVEVESEGLRSVMGVLADTVSQVIDLRREEMEPAPDFGTRVKVDYLLGLGRLGKKFVLILDIDTVLSMAELKTVDASISAVETGEGSTPKDPDEPELEFEAAAEESVT
jgi:purine-binding chemotaxis protein CheW